MTRYALPLAAALLAAALCYTVVAPQGHANDLTWPLRGARALVAGDNLCYNSNAMSASRGFFVPKEYPMRLALTLILALALVPAQSQPVATWDTQGRLLVFWPQEISGERCISKEAPGGAVYDYGCFWFFGEVGGGGRMALPLPGSTPDAYPQTGDTIIVNGVGVIVGPHLSYLPLVAR